MKTKSIERGGIKITAETTTVIKIELSHDRAKCIWHQLVEGDDELVDLSDDSETPDVADFLNTLNEVL